MHLLFTRRSVAALAAAGLLLAACDSSGDGGGSSSGTSSGSSEATATPQQSSNSPVPSPTTSASKPDPSASPGRTESEPSQVHGVATSVQVQGDATNGIGTPWGIALLSDGAALIAERDSAEILRRDRDGSLHSLGTVPGVVPYGEGGLLGLAVRPGDDTMVWAYFSTESDNRIARISLEGGRVGEPDVIVSGMPRATYHNGGRLAFGPDGMLYAGTGDGTVGDNSQDKDSLGGKILRVKPDGGIPDDNPFQGSPVYSYGHRNVQGLAFDSAGRLWATEFGQDTWDELNLIRPGRNYGWPVVEGKAGEEGYVDPVVQWSPDEASPSGLAIVDDVAYLATLKGERLWQVPLRGDGAAEPKAYLIGEYGRLRTVVAVGPHALWVTTSNLDGRGIGRDGDDRILKVALG